MKRLLILASPVYSLGGGLRHALAFGRAASDGGWQTEIVVASRAGGTGIADLANLVAPSAGVRVHDGGSLRSLAWTLISIFRWLWSGGGVIYAPFPQAMLLAYLAARVCGRRGHLIVGFQGSPIPESVAGWKRVIYRFALARLLVDPAVGVVSVSEAQLQEAFTRLGRSGAVRGVVIGNVAHSVGDAPWVEARQRPPRGARPGYTAVVLARLSWEKGVDVAIRAMSHVDPSVTLKIGGDGPQRSELEQLAASIGVADRVAFVGWCDSRDLLADASVVLIPSRREGLPAVLLEAAWQRVPVVASAVGGIPEVAKDMPGTVLVEPDDEHALATALMDALDQSPSERTPKANWEAFQDAVEEALA